MPSLRGRLRDLRNDSLLSSRELTAEDAKSIAPAAAGGVGAALLSRHSPRLVGREIFNTEVKLSKEQLEAMRRELSPSTKMPMIEDLKATTKGKPVPAAEIRKYLLSQGEYHSSGKDAAIFHRTRDGGTLRGQIAAHELGHGRLHNKPVIGKMIRAGYRAKYPMMIPAIGFAALAPEDSAIGDAAQYGGIAATAPQLIDEGYASIKGYGALKKHVKNQAIRRAARRDLMRAFATYGAGAAPLIAAPFVARKIRKKMSEK